MVLLLHLDAVHVPAQLVVHPFLILNMTQDAAYNKLCHRFPVVAPFGLFWFVGECGC